MAVALDRRDGVVELGFGQLVEVEVAQLAVTVPPGEVTEHLSGLGVQLGDVPGGRPVIGAEELDVGHGVEALAVLRTQLGENLAHVSRQELVTPEALLGFFAHGPQLTPSSGCCQAYSNRVANRLTLLGRCCIFVL